jgi:hypothetical protein
VLGLTFRFLAGGRVVDIISIYGISVNSSDRIILKCLNAINDCPHPLLSIMLPDPKDHKALHNLAMRWNRLSTAGELYFSHLLAQDGLLAETPRPGDVTNQPVYFSGHYKSYGLNVQAGAGPDLEFICISLLLGQAV